MVIHFQFLDSISNEFYYEDDDESFYNDITFDSSTFQIPNKNLPTNTNRMNYSNQSKSNDNFNQNANGFINKEDQPGSSVASNLYRVMGRTSPAMIAKSIQINRATPSPGSQNRPAHLRLNNL